MTSTALHPPPRLTAVLTAHVRALALALRTPAAIAAGLFALATLLITTDLLPGADVRAFNVIDVHPEQWVLSGLAGVLLAIAVWKDEQRFDAGFLWTLPVDRARHALLRVLAGWVWLMAAVALFVLWLVAVAVLSGESVLQETTLHVLPRGMPPEPLSAAELQVVRWSPHPLLWLVPFTGATGAYLITSAVALGVRRPLRWLGVLTLALFLLALVGSAMGAAWLELVPSRLLTALVYGHYGLDTLLTTGTDALRTHATLSTGERVPVWRAAPDLGRWAAATAIWMAAGIAALWAAAARHGDSRRAQA